MKNMPSSSSVESKPMTQLDYRRELALETRRHIGEGRKPPGRPKFDATEEAFNAEEEQKKKKKMQVILFPTAKKHVKEEPAEDMGSMINK